MTNEIVPFAEANRFLSMVDKQPFKCWEWLGPRRGSGYGEFSLHKKNHLAHRVMWALTFGESPKQHVLHRCDNPGCVNPLHLMDGSQSDNMRDKIIKGRHRSKSKTGGKLIPEQVRAIRADPRPQSAIAKDFGISQVMVSCIKRGASWRYV